MGVNHDEGTYFLMYGVPGFGISNDSLISRALFLQNVNLVESGLDSVSRQAVIFEYSDWADVNNSTKNRDCLGKMATDSNFICTVQEFGSRYKRAIVAPFPSWVLKCNWLHLKPPWIS